MYFEMFNIVRNELNKADPMGLQPGVFAPADEYAPETTKILAKLRSGIDYIELSQRISAVFLEMFDEKFSKTVFYACAKNILEQLSELK